MLKLYHAPACLPSTLPNRQLRFLPSNPRRRPRSIVVTVMVFSASPSGAAPKGRPMEPLGEKVVERSGFEPLKAIASRFTVCPVWPLRYLSTPRSVQQTSRFVTPSDGRSSHLCKAKYLHGFAWEASSFVSESRPPRSNGWTGFRLKG